MEIKYKIKAHESFSIRKGWLHKGIKNILADHRLFNGDKNPSDILGLGTNMVKALRYWLIATDLMEEVNSKGQKIQQLTDFGKLVNQYDTFNEEEGTNYLIHYKLAINESMATAWYWFFNEYSGNTIDKERFVREFLEYVKTKYSAEPATSIVEDEYVCLMKTYLNKEIDDNIDPEETKDCPLSELGLLKIINKRTKEYKKSTPYNDDIHPLIAYAVICDQIGDKDEVLISSLLNDKKNIGKVFNLDRPTLIYILEQIKKRKMITISRTAGLDVISIKTKKTFLECLELYYKDLDRGDE